jgi:AAA domain
VTSDGTKRPDIRRWTPYRTERPTPEQMRAFRFEQRTGFGMIAGLVSGRRGAWDFDCPDTHAAFMVAAEASGLYDLVQRIEAGYCDQTPGGGRRWIVHYPESVAWRDETLARRPGGDGEPHVKTLIELPTFAILAPSHGPTHPSGRPYIRLTGGFNTIAAVTAEEHTDLVTLARTFDAMPRPQRGEVTTAHRSGDRPGDDFNRRASWPEIVEPAGWRHVYDRGDVGYWCRQGKTHGVSPSTNLGGHDRLYVFTSSTPFEPETSYTKFAAYAVLHHGGDFAAAARDVAAEARTARSTTTPGGDPPDDREAVRAPIHARPVLVRLQDVRPEPVTWLWPGRLAAGKIALLVGDPGLGKSWITLDLAARLSAGRAMPDDGPAVPPGDVILLSAEDGLADTIRPRLDALGADVARIHHLAVLRAGDAERAVQLNDIAALDFAIRETGARLIIIDPIAAYLGSTDAHRDAEVRGLMAPLAALAERTDAAILGVMHLAKNAQRPAIYRAVGSIAFAAAARTVLAVAADPERDDRRIMAAVKSNLAASPAALAYTLSDGRLVWAAEPVSQVDVDALLRGPVLDRQERRAADDWLLERLADGPVPVGEIRAAARGAGLAWRTLERAKTRLGVQAELLGYGSAGRWQWHLPETANGTGHSSVTARFHDVAVSDETAAKLADLSRDRHSADLAVSEDLAVSGTPATGEGPRERARF